MEVIALKYAIEADTIDATLHHISKFSCKDSDVELFLKQKAIDFERRNKSRSYLIYADNLVDILGYFTLSLKAINFQSHVSTNLIKQIDGFSGNVDSTAMILIGQFGKNQNFMSELKGDDLFAVCMDIIYQIQSLVGGRFIILECQDIAKIVSFYTKHGFKLLQNSTDMKYSQMIKKL